MLLVASAIFVARQEPALDG